MGIADLNACGIFTIALCHALITTSLEIAGVGKVDGIRNLSRNRIERLVYVRVDHRLALLQTYCIRVERVMENVMGSLIGFTLNL